MSKAYNLKEQIKELNGTINYYEKKINNCKDKVKKFEEISKKYPDIEYYGGKIFYLPDPSLAKKITFSAGNINRIDYHANYRALNSNYTARKNYDYLYPKTIYSYFLDNDLKIICDKNILLIESRIYNSNQTVEVKDYSAFFDKSSCKDKLVKSTKKLLLKYLISMSNNVNITITNNSFDKEKIQGMLLFK